MGSDHLDGDVCVNFIKTIFQSLRNGVIDYKQVQFSNCVCKNQMFMQKTGQVGFCADKQLFSDNLLGDK